MNTVKRLAKLFRTNRVQLKDWHCPENTNAGGQSVHRVTGTLSRCPMSRPKHQQQAAYRSGTLASFLPYSPVFPASHPETNSCKRIITADSAYELSSETTKLITSWWTYQGERS